ncbi:tail fiber domain-containing protein [Aminobacter sp. MDW-2]|nr:tail fiber domain-containing protein [Aminobacter sp. MDW-2]MRX32799.1 tail fiber domain-containing protein [Aminobacter sp. MDW-2]QNH36971.1 tail fiber domain-containing protein [Aminobacter sp. MDW-2]
MGKGSSNPPAPDPQIGKAALLQAETGKEWLSFAKDAFAVSEKRQVELDKLTKEVSDLQIGLAKDQVSWARQDRERYDTKFKPIEDQFIQEATNYASPEKQAEAAATAKADVQSAAADSRETARREATSMGVNPNSGRFAGVERAGELATTAASAGAQNNARQMVRDKGLALKADVVNLGRGLPTQSAQAASLGLSAGGSAVGLNQGTNAQYLASTDIMGSGFKGQMAGYQGQGQLLNAQYGNQIAAWDAGNRAKAANASGIGSFIGGIAGLFASDENAKEDKAAIPEGDALDAVNSMPVEEWTYKEGVGDGGRHVGPYAQDFQEATGKGDGKTIAVQDALGITMKAVQDLDGKVEKIAQAVGLGGGEARPPAARRKSQQPTAARPTSTPAQPKPTPAAMARHKNAPVGLGGAA